MNDFNFHFIVFNCFLFQLTPIRPPPSRRKNNTLTYRFGKVIYAIDTFFILRITRIATIKKIVLEKETDRDIT